MDSSSDSSSKALNASMSLLMIALTVLIGVGLICAVTFLVSNSSYWSVPGLGTPSSPLGAGSNPAGALATITPGGPELTPTPDSPHALPPIRMEPEKYTVRSGDSLGAIAQRYGISLEQLIHQNNLANPNLLEVGQVLNVPAPTPEGSGSPFKIIPDSELVYGPVNTHFDTPGFIQSWGGYLAGYQEEVGEEMLSGAQIVERISQNYSVNPRLLLVVLEHQSGWLTLSDSPVSFLEKPIGNLGPNAKGLYIQLGWVANNLNRGYYLWRVNAVPTWVLSDGSVVPINPTINAGTAGVQHLYSLLYDMNEWNEVVSENGLQATYRSLFGNPFAYSVEPLMPPDLQQPAMQLPFEDGKVWAFTGGPHGGWASGSAWAALDFAPPGDTLGCVQSDEWVVAVADGLILRAENGAVMQDLDGDGLEGTGWVVLYMHIESRERVQPGTFLKAGERIGHASCEGGVSSGTHVHLARRYNGEWIPADQQIPFILDGWISSGTGNLYDGYLERDGQLVEAYAGREETNAIKR